MDTIKSTTVSDEFLNECRSVNRQAGSLRLRIRNKLEPIMNESESCAEDDEAQSYPYPHYYALLFDELRAIRNNLDVINRYIDRTCFPDGDTVKDDTETVSPLLSSTKKRPY